MQNEPLSSQVGISPETLPFRHAGDPGPLSAGELAMLSFFADLGREELEVIATHTKISHFAAGDVIVSQDSPADRFYVILSGRVGIERELPEGRLPVEQIGPGSTVGFSWMFEPEKVHFTARAIDPVAAVFFHGTLLRAECERSPRLGYELAKRAGRCMLKRLEAIINIVSQDR